MHRINCARSLAYFGLILTMISLACTAPVQAQFLRSPGRNLPGFDAGGVPVSRSLNAAQGLAFCEQRCGASPNCFGYTFFGPGPGVPAICTFKNGAGMYDNPPTVAATNATTGIRSARRDMCWAREVFVLKFCHVLSRLPACPRGSIRVQSYPFLAQDHPTARQNFVFACVFRTNVDPGGLPNCTDAFGSSRNEGDRGSVNRACLDSP